ncbi:unnamed protein product [Sphagnum balticum]
MTEDEVIKAALEDFKTASDAEAQNRKDMLEDLQFRAGEQWPDFVYSSRETDNRPTLTINRLPQFIRQITNDARHNRPSIKVAPVDDGADQEVAEVLNGLFRHIEVSSNADIAYDTAVDNQVTMGLGYIRVLTDYTDDDSFEQDIKIKWVKNPFTVYYDPNCVEPDYSDAKYAFVVEDIPIEEYKRMYPESKMVGMDNFKSTGDNNLGGWTNNKTVRVAEYFRKEAVKKTLYLLNDGSTTTEKPKDDKDIALDPETGKPKTRPTTEWQVTWYKVNGIEILEQKKWPGKYIPIVPVIGEDLIIDGKRVIFGLVRGARDSQRMLNYWTSAITEAIALAPKAPFMVAEGQVEGYEQFWNDANTRSYAFLTYKQTDLEGRQAPMPQRNQAEPPVQAMMAAMQQAGQNLKDTTGIYDDSLGQRNQEEVSGKAILARQKQSNISNFHYLDNLSRSIEYLARIVLDLIPSIYDTARTIRIIGEDEIHSQVQINQKQTMDNGQPKLDENGAVKKAISFGVGKYDVVVTSGPSYSTRRQEAAASMLNVVQSYPQLMQVAGDLLVKNLDWPGSEALAERLEKTLPPNLQPQPDGKPQLPPQVQQAMAQSQQMIQKLTQELNQVQIELKTKAAELATKERIAKMDADRSIAVEAMKHESRANHEILMQQLRDISAQNQMQQSQNMQAVQQTQPQQLPQQ